MFVKYLMISRVHMKKIKTKYKIMGHQFVHLKNNHNKFVKKNKVVV